MMVGCFFALVYLMLTGINAGSAERPFLGDREDSIVRAIYAVFVAIPTEDL